MKTDSLSTERCSCCLVEVKSSAGVKDYHLPVVAVQYWVLKSSIDSQL